MSETDVEQKKSFFSDKYNIFILGIVIFAFVLLLRYFNINQALWWDEAEYLSIAKHWAFGVPFDVSYIRPPLFPTMVTFFYAIFGPSEFVLRAFMLVISVFGIYLTYLVAKEILHKRVALVSSFMISVSYLSIFYTARILIDILMMVMWLLAIFFFWKGYVKKGPKYYLWLMGVMIGLGASLKMPFVFVAAPFVVYAFLEEGFAMFKNKQLWLSVVFFFIGILPYFIYFNLSYGGLPFISTPSYGFGKEGFTSFYVNVMPVVLKSPIPLLQNIWVFQIFLIMFVAGLAYIIMNLVLGWDLLRKEHLLKVYAFLLAWIVVPFFFFSLISMAEDRYLMMIYPAVFMVASLMLFKCYDFVKKYNRYVALAFVFAILLSYAYAQVSYGSALTKSKSTSYLQLKEAALWMKDRSSPDDLILNSGVPQNTYYSERNTTFYPESEADFDKFIADYKPRFMVISVFERSPDWTYDWPDKNQGRVVPVQAYYADVERQQPLLIIYQFVDNSTS